jgi:hypothetical protein
LCFLSVACDRDRTSQPNERPSRVAAGQSGRDTGLAAVRDSLERDSLERARRDSVNRARPGYVIDSILPVEEEIRRFQATLADRPDSLAGGATSRTALVRAFVRAVERGDDHALRRLVVDRGEFGALIYPSSPNVRPPYRLSPAIVWLQRSAATDKAAARLIGRFGGSRLAYDGYSCSEPFEPQGENRVWTNCVVRRRIGPGDSATLRMFGPIVERGGRYKFLSLAGGL